MKKISYEIVSLESVPKEDIPTIVSLQGLVNRSEPALYVIPKPASPEQHWVKWYEGYGLKGRNISAEELFSRYASRAKGFIVFDPDMPDSLNVALCLAGVEDALVCPPAGAKKLEKLGLSCIADFTLKWPHGVLASRWAVDHVMPRCNSFFLACYDQSQGLRPFPTMDFLIARRGFCMGLSINDADFPEQADLWNEALNAAPDHALLFGWHTKNDSEATYVYFASRHNTRVYCGFAWNMSFHYHVKAKKKYSQDHCEKAACNPKSKYATLTLSDGDSWHSMCDVQKKFWLHKKRGEVPLGWQVSPVFTELAPALLEYYYDTRTPNDYILCGCSGIAYNYLSGYPDWKGYLERSAKIMKTCSLKTIWTINRIVRHLPGGAIEHQLKQGPVCYTREQMEEFGGIKDEKGADIVDPVVIERYMEVILDAPGFFQGWERIPGENPVWHKGKVWCPTGALVRNDIDAVIREFENAAASQPRPAFVAAHINCYKADMDVVIETARRLEQKDFKLVRPDVFLRLAQDCPR